MFQLEAPGRTSGRASGQGESRGFKPACASFDGSGRPALWHGRALHVAASCAGATTTRLGAMRIKLTNMLSIFADSFGQQASRFEAVVGHGCSPAANLIFPACLGRCLVTNKSSLCISCEEFKHSKSIAARARLLQIQIGVNCLCRSRALATKAVQFRLVRLRNQG